ncbi:hypothetical protein FF32_18435 [Halomonas campaniensis]|nr:hypothetical protein FF32_18435 [Halomonas campaniensis]
MNIEREVAGLCEEKIDKIFSSTWFGKSLAPGTGAKLWQDGSVCILNQPSYKLEIPVNWLDDPYNHRSWRWILNAFQWMDQLLARFKLNQDEEAVQKCVTYFLDWASFYVVEEREGEFLWKDDAVSFRTFRLSIIAAYIFNSDRYTNEERELTEKVLHKHYLELSNPKKFKSNNHGIFQMRALMSLLSLHPSVGSVKESRKYVTKRLNWLWERQYGTQNIHLENSTGYHQYIIKEFEEILDSPELKDFKFSFDNRVIEEVKDNAKYLFHPNGTGTLFGDSNFVQQEHKIVTGDHIFNEAGYAILAGSKPIKENSYLAVRTGFPSNAHRHSDDFSFEWSERGTVILQDSGRYAYDYNHPLREFVTSSMAHNTVTVDRLNYPWWGRFEKSDFYSGAVSKLSSGGEGETTFVIQKKFEKLDFDFCRQLHFVKGESLTIQDALLSDRKREYVQWFHFSENFFPVDESFESGVVFQCDSFKVKVEHFSEGSLIFFNGQKKPFYQGWVSYKEKHAAPRWTIGFVVNAKHAKIKTRLTLQD